MGGVMSIEQASRQVEAQFVHTQIEYAMSQFRSEQSLLMGTAAGAVAGVVGAGAWALVTTLTHFQIGWMAVGIGFLVGIAIRTFGKGIDKVFGVIGAILALSGCVLGNLLAVCGMVASHQHIP